MSEILRELAEEVAVDLRSGLRCIDGQVSCLCVDDGRNIIAAMKPKPSRGQRITSFSLGQERWQVEWSKEDVVHSDRGNTTASFLSPLLELSTIETRHKMRQAK